VYDAFNRIVNSDGVDIEYWDVAFIHAWDKQNHTFGTGEISKLFASLPDGVSIGNAAFAKNSPYILAFDYIDENSGDIEVLGVNIETSAVGTIALNTTLGYPSFNKSDTRVAFTRENGSDDYLTSYVTLNANKISSNLSELDIFDFTMWPVYFASGNRVIGDNEEVTGIEDHSEKLSLTAYPNPFNDEIKIKTDSPLTATADVDMFNIMGKRVSGLRVTVLDPTTVQLNIRDLTAGQYIIRINNGVRSGVKKVVKVR
jgi:hypothetical protein